TVFTGSGPLHVANCRFLRNGNSPSLEGEASVFTVRNCEFTGNPIAPPHLVPYLSSNGQVLLENNLFSDPHGRSLGLLWKRPDLHNATVRLSHNTMAWIEQGLDTLPESAGPGAAPDRQPVRIHLSENLFDPIGAPGGLFSWLTLPDWY